MYLDSLTDHLEDQSQGKTSYILEPILKTCKVFIWEALKKQFSSAGLKNRHNYHQPSLIISYSAT